MSRLPKLLIVLATLILLSFATSTINATTLVVGNNDNISRYAFGMDPGNASSSFPDFTAGGIYQQVYANNAFAGPGNHNADSLRFQRTSYLWPRNSDV